MTMYGQFDGGQPVERPLASPAPRLGTVVETLIIALASVGGGWAVNILSDANTLWTAAIAAGIGLLLFAAIERLRASMDPSREAAARGRALRGCAALLLIAGLLFTGDQVSRHYPCQFRWASPDMLACYDFGAADGWSVDPSRGEAIYTDGVLQISGNAGVAMWVAAPQAPLPASIKMTAKARLTSPGAGAWGLWCRGNADGSRRYEFTVTHDGHAYIKVGEDVADLWQVDDFQADREHTIQGVCRDLPGTGVELVLRVDDRVVGRATDQGGQVLGPGRVGVYAATFGDTAPSDPPVVSFDEFTVERDHRD